jgi:prophage maintenance system killer protein
MKKGTTHNQVVIYQSKSGALELHQDFDKETVWARQSDIAKLYGKERSVITRHISNILKDREIDQKSNVQKMHIANSDKPVVVYSLDIILAVGYRTNSKRAIQFRQWATKTLRQHIVEGYTINKTRIASNYKQFLEVVESIKQLLPSGTPIDTTSVLELINLFADTWLSLEAYDRDALPTRGRTKKQVELTAEKLVNRLTELKTQLMKKGEATELFGAERSAGSIAGIVGNVMQSFGGKDLYETLEEKAAHLLYFMVKNHPFTDGNKRNGAYAFVWFLQETGILDTRRLTPPALTTLTILVAESNPKDKEKMIHLILSLLN